MSEETHPDGVLTAEAPPPPEPSRRTPVLRILLAALATVGVVVLATLAWNEDRSRTFEETFPEDYVGPVWLTLATAGDDPHTVDVEWGRLSTSFTHSGPEPRTYFFDRGTAVYGRAGPLLVEVSPAADVEFGFGPAPPGGIDIGAVPWDVEPEEVVGETRPASQDRTTASAVVNEYITYGLVVEGVTVLDEPSFDGEGVTVVRHGDRLETSCWVEGQEVTNSNWSDPSDDGAEYTTTIWYQVQTDEGEGYLSDVWLGREADSGRMNLSEC